MELLREVSKEVSAADLREIRKFLEVSSLFLFFFNWRVIALQCCVGLCHTSTLNQPQVYICPLLCESSSQLPPHPTPLGCHRALG